MLSRATNVISQFIYMTFSFYVIEHTTITVNNFYFQLISTLGRDLAPYQLFTAYPQLISRICHAQSDVFQQLKEIIARIFVHFPQQSLWMMMAVSKVNLTVFVDDNDRLYLWSSYSVQSRNFSLGVIMAQAFWQKGHYWKNAVNKKIPSIYNNLYQKKVSTKIGGSRK